MANQDKTQPTSGNLFQSAALALGAGAASMTFSATPPAAGATPMRQASAASDSAASAPVLELVKAQIDAAEARLEAKMADRLGALSQQIANLATDMAKIGQLDTKVQTLSNDIAKMPGTPTIFGAAGSAVLAVLAILAFGGDRFDGGIAAGSTLVDSAVESKAMDDRQDAQIREANRRLDELSKKSGN